MVIKRNVLITAGSTWVALDKVRVISNIASGETGFILADRFRRLGAKVTLLLGPGDFYALKIRGIKVIRFKYLSQLDQLLKKELRKRIYSVVVHAAAAADYQPRKTFRKKVSSRLAHWKIDLVPAKKLINKLKDYDPGLIAVGFKFEPGGGKKMLIKKGNSLIKQANLDLVVANSQRNKGYQAYITDGERKHGPFLSKPAMAACLLKLIEKRI
ncbi:MAG: phosphopantothenoylcysteine decarboxylase [Candidatus Omnitrophica bacterium]|nr:phosphopantothenoylcysteine decarboxylase [Candidatus Omnitrophota bacterium]